MTERDFLDYLEDCGFELPCNKVGFTSGIYSRTFQLGMNVYTVMYDMHNPEWFEISKEFMYE